jgi:hypothetical protein
MLSNLLTPCPCLFGRKALKGVFVANLSLLKFTAILPFEGIKG